MLTFTLDTLKQICEFYDVHRSHLGTPTLIEKGRDTLPELFWALGFTRGAEIGVETGLYSEIIADKMPGVNLHSIDAWQAYPGYRDHVTQEKLDGFYAQAQKRLEGKSNIIRKFSVAASIDFEDGELDFVYIDANHEFLEVTQDIHYWTPKVRKGGIIAGHDFKRTKGAYIIHVKDVVQAWAYSHGINPWFVLNGDKSPSWFWVKQ